MHKSCQNLDYYIFTVKIRWKRKFWLKSILQTRQEQLNFENNYMNPVY